jgi:ribonucleoside-triphosphate reductase (thioredoxin)
MKITKRSGQTEKFNKNKIYRAVYNCLHKSLHKPESVAKEISDKVTELVVKDLTKNQQKYFKDKPIHVEDIQNFIVKAMCNLGLFEEAEVFTLWRYEKKILREKYHAKYSPEELTKLNKDIVSYFPTPLQQFQYISKFARYLDDKNRRETWPETVDRVLKFFKNKGLPLETEEWEKLRIAMLKLEAAPAMRVIQMAGPALERCNVCAYNCSYLPIKELFNFAEVLYILMQGTGVGYSVERKYINQLPPIKLFKNRPPIKKLVIEDSTEGWCNALYEGMQYWFEGEDIEFDYSHIRPLGSRLKTKGGFASGPEPLKKLLTFVRSKIIQRSEQGQKLTPLDCHDICCMIGQIVQVGGVRRAAMISLSDLDDNELKLCKFGNEWYLNAPWRSMANNSAVYEFLPESEKLLDEWYHLVKGKSGERGIFSRYAANNSLPERRKPCPDFGTNPCGEIILRPYQFCNLSMALIRPEDNFEKILEKVTVATIFGTMQATLTDFNYISPLWKQTCEEERLLGVDIPGNCDNKILGPHVPHKELAEALEKLRNHVVKINKIYAKKFGINQATAATCIKPGGDSSVLFDVSPSILPRYSRYYIRRVRCHKSDPVAKLMIDEGVPYHIDTFNPDLVVFEFPVEAKGVGDKKLSALDIFDRWLTFKKHWAEHSVSCTIYVRKHEWIELLHRVYKEFDQITGLTFLHYDETTYPLMPYEEISKEKYEELVKVFPDINWSKLIRYEFEDTTNPLATPACAGGLCELNSGGSHDL